MRLAITVSCGFLRAGLNLKVIREGYRGVWGVRLLDIALRYVRVIVRGKDVLYFSAHEYMKKWIPVSKLENYVHLCLKPSYFVCLLLYVSHAVVGSPIWLASEVSDAHSGSRRDKLFMKSRKKGI